MEKQYVFSFHEGNKDMKHILGGKGANLAEMTSIGMPVPPGFIISTEACDLFYKNNKRLTNEIKEQKRIISRIKEKRPHTQSPFHTHIPSSYLPVLEGNRGQVPFSREIRRFLKKIK